MPVKTGIQSEPNLDSGVRRNDANGAETSGARS